jgi:hypothetical protein
VSEAAIAGRSYYSDPKSVGSRMRLARLRRFVVPLIEAAHARKGAVRLLDIGGVADYWAPIQADLDRFSCKVTILNMVLSQAVTGASKNFEFVEGNACATGLDDLSFDLVHSSSLLEHLGAWENMLAAAAETRRLAPAYYVQVPYFWFPMEPHFRVVGFQWLPQQIRARLLMRKARGFFAKAADMDEAMRMVQNVYLLDLRQMQALFPDATFAREKMFGLTKSLIAIRA